MKLKLITPALLLSATLTWAQDPKPADPNPSEPKTEEKQPEEIKPEAKPDGSKPAEPEKGAPPKEAPKQEAPNQEEKKQEPKVQLPPLPKFAEVGKDKYGKMVPEVMNLYKPLLAEVRRSTVQIIGKPWNKTLALGCVVHEDGYFLTKLSEMHKAKEHFAVFPKSDLFPAGLKIPVKLVAEHKAYDLALLKAEASGFTPIQWATDANPTPGTFLVAGGLTEDPLAIGVVSVLPRNLNDGEKGFMGVQLELVDNRIKITRIVPAGPAQEAGLKEGDLVLQVNEKKIATVDDFISFVSAKKPADKVQVKVKRGEEEKEFGVILRARSEFIQLGAMEDPRNNLSGQLSDTRRGFPAALQHDLYLKPEHCGGPLVNLDGKVVGINIARSGRIESLAIPADVVAVLLKDVANGRFHYPEAEAILKGRATINEEMAAVEEQMKMLTQKQGSLKKQIEALDKKLSDLGLKPETK